MHNFFAFDSIVYAWYDIVMIAISRNAVAFRKADFIGF